MAALDRQSLSQFGRIGGGDCLKRFAPLTTLGFTGDVAIQENGSRIAFMVFCANANVHVQPEPLVSGIGPAIGFPVGILTPLVLTWNDIGPLVQSAWVCTDGGVGTIFATWEIVKLDSPTSPIDTALSIEKVASNGNFRKSDFPSSVDNLRRVLGTVTGPGSNRTVLPADEQGNSVVGLTGRAGPRGNFVPGGAASHVMQIRNRVSNRASG